MIIQGGEPFLFVGNKTGILLIHGFTGAPKEMRWMGEYLHSRSYTVLGVRLAGHSTNPNDLPRMTWKDWMASVEDGFDYLKCFCDQIFIAGLSLGGILALTSAAVLPAQGVIAMSTPYLPPDPRLKFARWIHHLYPWAAKGPSDWLEAEVAHDHLEYPLYSTRGFVQLIELQEVMRNSLPSIQTPALIVHSLTDQAVNTEHAQQIYDHLGSRDKQLVWIEKSGHVVTRDISRQQVFEAAENFIQRISLRV
jgi:carboxylesterase